MGKFIEIFDTTLRDGSQGEGINFSVQDKIHVVKALDELGVKFIEAGNPASNPKDAEFFEKAKSLSLKNAHLVAFGSTRRKDCSCAEDSSLQKLLAAGTDYVCIFGKSWDFQVTEILQTTLEDNLEMIRDTCAYLKSHGKEVIFDAEHFFSGYEANPDYAMKSLQSAIDGGASTLVLCETRGGAMISQCSSVVSQVVKKFGSGAVIGIHTHNDSGLAVANSLVAVESGATHIQGVLLGFGERTGNANLSTVISNLQLKMGYSCIPADNLKLLAPVCRRIAEIANISVPGKMPYVGRCAFAHKAGMHIDAVLKNPDAYEHINPELVGNERMFLMSDAAGRSMIIEKIKKFDSSITKNSPVVSQVVQKVKELEHQGYLFEGADGSFELLVRKIMGLYKPFFNLCYYKTHDEYPLVEKGLYSFAQLKIDVNGHKQMAAGEGNGPVNALDVALRSALKEFYPKVEELKLIDYKVRVLDGKNATASRVRVLIESTDGNENWTTVGVSCDIVEASWHALVDSFEYKMCKG